MQSESLRQVSADGAQRRDITVLFVDFAGSTELARTMDPEACHRLLSAFLEHCAVCISSAGGHVARFMGDGVLAYFGFPQVREDDAQRAVSAALAIRDGCPRLGSLVSARSGIASGSVILGVAIGSGEAREVPVFGDAANLASRLQAAAQPGHILVAQGVTERTGECFSFRQSPPLVLKGFPELRHGWEVLGPKRSGRVTDGNGAPEGPIIGREDERGRLIAAWRAARDGHGGAFLIEGQAGVGKTRLVAELANHLLPEVHAHVVAADSLRTQAPLGLISRLLEQLSRDHSGDMLQPHWSAEGGEATRGNVIARTIVDSIGEPAILILEDLHWADPSSREVIDAMALEVAERPVLIVATSRLETGGMPGAGWQRIPLEPLGPAQTAELVGGLAGGGLSANDVQHVIARSGGVPLFARELVRLLSDAGRRPDVRSVPETLAGLLLARLTALGPSMALAQCAAVLGVEAPVSTLSTLAERRGVNLAAGLKALEHERVATIFGSPPRLRFTHALFREAALETLLADDSRALHRDAVDILEDDAEGVPDSVLAEFWERAGDRERALQALDRAVAAARERRAWPEVRHLTEWCLALLRQVPLERQDIQLELKTRNLHAEALQITTGYSSPATRAAAAEAQRTARRVGEIYQSMLGVAGQWMAASSAGDYRKAQAIAAECMSLARLHGGADALAAGHMVEMTTRYRVGDLVGAEASFVSGQGFFDAEPFLARAGAIPQTFGNAALVAVLLGDSVAARQRCAHALRASRRQPSPYDRCFAAYMVAMVEILLGADRRAAGLGETALRLAGALGFPQFAATARIVLGRARAGYGDVASGMALLRQGLQGMAEAHARNAQTLYLTWFGEAALLGGDLDAAIEATRSALEINPDELFYRPEALRVRALALLGQGQAEEARNVLEEGLALARAMHAPWFLNRMQPLVGRLGLSDQAMRTSSPSTTSMAISFGDLPV